FVLASEHKLEVAIPTELPPVMADPRRIAQVIGNLVNNAVKYSPAGSRIMVAAGLEPDKIVFSVTDEGHGIPEDEREMVFQPFQQASNRSHKETKGAGLGLAIARALVEAHSGRIWVADHDGSGTRIAFTVPLASEPAAAPEH